MRRAIASDTDVGRAIARDLVVPLFERTRVDEFRPSIYSWALNQPKRGLLLLMVSSVMLGSKLGLGASPCEEEEE